MESQPPIEAVIAQVGGEPPEYPGAPSTHRVRFNCLPRVGELIDVQAINDVATGYESKWRYEVVRIIHQARDLDAVASGDIGYHQPMLLVKKFKGVYSAGL